jgi:outer membrane protein assembly factor BamB
VVLSSLSIANGVGYIGDGAGNVFGFDLKTGERLWSAEAQTTFYGTPAVVNGMVYVGSYDGSMYAYALDGGQNPAYNTNRPPPSYALLHPNRQLKPGK